MNKQTDHIDWTDVLFIPLALVLSYVLALWLHRALATTISFVLVLLVFVLLKPRKGSLKGLVVSIVCGAMIVYILVALFNWPP